MSNKKTQVNSDLEKDINKNCCKNHCECNDNCDCNDSCDCGDNCNCDDNNRCSDNCKCNSQKDCKSHDKQSDGCCCEHHHNENAVPNEVLYYLDLAQRTKADFDNYKRRNADVAKTSYENGLSYAVEKLLPVIDGITQAKLSIKDQATLEGFEIINTQFLSALSGLGVKKIESLGKEFDPNFHNAVLSDKDESKTDGVVLEEFQQGFMLNDKVIRHSVVKINKL